MVRKGRMKHYLRSLMIVAFGRKGDILDFGGEGMDRWINREILDFRKVACERSDAGTLAYLRVPFSNEAGMVLCTSSLCFACGRSSHYIYWCTAQSYVSLGS